MEKNHFMHFAHGQMRERKFNGNNYNKSFGISRSPSLGGWSCVHRSWSMCKVRNTPNTWEGGPIRWKVHTHDVLIFLPPSNSTFCAILWNIWNLVSSDARSPHASTSSRAKIETFFRWINKYANHFLAKAEKLFKQNEKKNQTITFRFFFFLCSGFHFRSNILRFAKRRFGMSRKSKWKSEKRVCATRERTTHEIRFSNRVATSSWVHAGYLEWDLSDG